MSNKTIEICGVKYVLYGWGEDASTGKKEPHITVAQTGIIPKGQQRRLLKEYLVSNSVNIEPWSEKTTHWCVLEAIKLNSSTGITTVSTKITITSDHVCLEELTVANIEAKSKLVSETNNYGKEGDIIRSVISKYPYNNDLNIVAMKIALIDVTNSTHLSLHKSNISLNDLAMIIIEIENIDNRIAHGDPEIVKIISNNTKNKYNVNLFSFASKYCTYHNRHKYNRDDYSIYDSVVQKYLPYYANDIKENTIKKWKESFNYAAFNDCIGNVLETNGITAEACPKRRKEFDHFLWFTNKDIDKGKKNKL